MAPITCYAVDAAGICFQGMRVLLGCYDWNGNLVFQLSAYTENDGSVCWWLPDMCHPSYAPLLTDHLGYHRIRVIFFTYEYFGSSLQPWVDVSADLYLSGQFHHIITLQLLGDNTQFNIKHDCKWLGQNHINTYLGAPQLEPTGTGEDDASSNAATWSRTQSPSATSSQGWNVCGSPDEYECPNGTTELFGNCEAQGLGAVVRKRKPETEMADLPLAKRRFVSERCLSAETV